ncbi:hypothetical protein AB0N06_27380 [Streptomyces sp. NPDC051020]|uniref:hypothetical protein n=1 Tax=Streptomyces sp. NPDC051020 TaxID=3155409 RepID=UPI00343776ED
MERHVDCGHHLAAAVGDRAAIERSPSSSALRLPHLRYVARSEAASASLAENYVGFKEN